ncbi:MAG: hypothetical protein ACJAX4_001472 [Clostridium sp.]|jgi:hypothetical protein
MNISYKKLLRFKLLKKHTIKIVAGKFFLHHTGIKLVILLLNKSLKIDKVREAI